MFDDFLIGQKREPYSLAEEQNQHVKVAFKIIDKISCKKTKQLFSNPLYFKPQLKMTKKKKMAYKPQ